MARQHLDSSNSGAPGSNREKNTAAVQTHGISWNAVAVAFSAVHN